MDTKQEQETGQAIDVQVTSVEPVIAPVEEATPQSTAENINVNEQSIESADNVGSDDIQNDPKTISEPTEQIGSQQSNKPATPVVTIIAAIFVAIVLAAITVYAYIQQQDSKVNSPTNNTDLPFTPAVSSEEVNQADKDIDEALNSVDESEFSESELSDQSLGL